MAVRRPIPLGRLTLQASPAPPCRDGIEQPSTTRMILRSMPWTKRSRNSANTAPLTLPSFTMKRKWRAALTAGSMFNRNERRCARPSASAQLTLRWYQHDGPSAKPPRRQRRSKPFPAWPALGAPKTHAENIPTPQRVALFRPTKRALRRQSQGMRDTAHRNLGERHAGLAANQIAHQRAGHSAKGKAYCRGFDQATMR